MKNLQETFVDDARSEFGLHIVTRSVQDQLAWMNITGIMFSIDWKRAGQGRGMFVEMLMGPILDTRRLIKQILARDMLFHYWKKWTWFFRLSFIFRRIIIFLKHWLGYETTHS